MKRATKHWVKRGVLRGAASFTGEDCADILDSDARQAAEVRRLRAEAKQKDIALDTMRRAVGLDIVSDHECWPTSPEKVLVDAAITAYERVRSALKPARRKP